MNSFTGAEREVRQCARTPAMVAGERTEKIMSKTNSNRELTNDELQLVAGGTYREAQESFKDAQRAFAHGDFAGGMADLAAAYKAMGSGGGGGWL